MFRRGTTGKIRRYLSKWSCLVAAVISNSAGLFLSHRHILDVYIGKWTAFDVKRRRFAGPVFHFVQIETQPGFITTSGTNAGVAGGSMTKAETPSYKLIEQQHGSAAEECGPLKTITINRLNAMKRTAAWKSIGTYRWRRLEGQAFQKWAELSADLWNKTNNYPSVTEATSKLKSQINQMHG